MAKFNGAKRAARALDNAAAHLGGEAQVQEMVASNRADLIRSSVAEIVRLGEEKAALNEQIAEIKGRVKGELGMKMADFSIALRIYRLEHDDRDQTLDTIRECFEALGVGTQGSLFPDQPAAVEAPAA